MTPLGELRRAWREQRPPSHGAATEDRWPVWSRRFVLPSLCIVVYGVLGAFTYGVHPPASNSIIPLCGCGDLSSQVWLTAWPAHALAHGLNPFYSSAVDYPNGINLMSNTGAPLLGIVFAPITWIFGPVATLNLLLRLGFALSGISMCFVLRRWTKSWPAAFIGGLLYAFSPFMVGQSQSHEFLSFAALPPIILALLDAIVIRRSRPVRNGVVLGLVLVAQLLISPETLAMCAVAAVFGLVVLTARHPVEAIKRTRDVLVGGAASALTFIVIGGYPIWVYLRGPFHISGPPHPLDELKTTWSSVDSLFYPTALQRLHLGSWYVKGSALLQGGNDAEHTTYIGIPLLIFLAYLLVRNRHSGIVQLFSLIALVAWATTLGTELHLGLTGQPGYNSILPYRLLDRIPLIDGGIDVRYSLIMYLAIVVVFAVGVDRISREGFWAARSVMKHRFAVDHRRRAPTLRLAAVGVLVVVALIPLVPHLPYTSTPVDIPSVFTASDSPLVPGEPVLVYPLPVDYIGFNDQALLWQAAADMRFRIVGFRGAIPGPGNKPLRYAATLLAPTQAEEALLWALYGQPSPPPRDATTSAAIRLFLRRYRIGAVVLVPSSGRTAALIQYFQDALGRKPVDFGGSYVWSSV